MKTIQYNLRKKFASVLFVLLFLMLANLFSQDHYDSEFSAIVIGQITNTETHAPIADHKVDINSSPEYNSEFSFSSTVFTNHEGYFIDTVRTDFIKGGLIISTSDYLGNIYEIEEYFRFNWSDNNVLFADFCLPVILVPSPYQANFDHFDDPENDNPFKYSFVDITNSDNIISWSWDFGDGESSELQNPEHVYKYSGIYKVSLTVVIESEQFPQPVESNIVRMIHVTTKNYYHLGGHIFADNFPIDYGAVYLYQINDKGITAIDTALFNDTLGYYLFYQVIEGEYFVLAEVLPNSLYFNQIIDTYYSNEIEWQKADTIFHYSTNWEYDILMNYDSESNYGPGNITGDISYQANSEIDEAMPAHNVEMLFFDENSILVECCHSNPNGQFELSNLEVGTYILQPEMIGKTTIPITINITDHNSDIDNITWTISDYYINGSVYGIGENEWVTFTSEVYPNPVRNTFNMDINLTASAELELNVYNNSGQLIKSSRNQFNHGSNTIHFSTDDLTEGLYYFTLSGEQTIVSRKFIIQ